MAKPAQNAGSAPGSGTGKKARAPQFSAALALCFVALIAYAYVLAGQTFGDAHYVQQTVPSVGYVAERLSALQIPEYWNGVGLGVPFAANPDHAALYLPSVFAAATPDSLLGMDLLMLAHMVLLGIGVASLARRLGAEADAAIVAGSVAIVGGLSTSALGDGSLFAIAWVPWVLASALVLAEAAERWQRARAGAVLAAFVAVHMFAGATLVLPAVLATALGLGVARSPSGCRARSALAIGAAMLAAGLLAAAVWVPAAYLELATDPLAVPLSASAAGDVLWSHGNSSTLFIGFPALMLAVFALVRGRRLACAGVVVLCFALGLLHAGICVVPGIVLLAALTGVGFSELRRCSSSRHRAAQRWAVAAAVIGLLGVGTLMMVRAEFTAGAALLVAIGGAVALLWWQPNGEPVVSQRRFAAAFWPLLGTLIVAHVLTVSRRQLPAVARTDFEQPPALLRGVTSDQDGRPARIVRPQLVLADAAGGSAIESLRRAFRTAAANSAVRFGFAYARGNDRAIDARNQRAWRAAALAGGRFLDLYGIELVAVPKSVTIAAGMPVVGGEAQTKTSLIENDQRRPRAFVAGRWRWYDDEAALLDSLFPEAIGGAAALALSTVHLSGVGVDGGGERAAPAWPCVITSYRPELVELECPESAEGYVVLLDAAGAGWTVEIEGEARAIERADLLVRAVRKERGEKRIVFRYHTPGLRLGLIVSGLAWLNLFVLLALARWRRAMLRAV